VVVSWHRKILHINVMKESNGPSGHSLIRIVAADTHDYPQQSVQIRKRRAELPGFPRGWGSKLHTFLQWQTLGQFHQGYGFRQLRRAGRGKAVPVRGDQKRVVHDDEAFSPSDRRYRLVGDAGKLKYGRMGKGYCSPNLQQGLSRDKQILLTRQQRARRPE